MLMKFRNFVTVAGFNILSGTEFQGGRGNMSTPTFGQGGETISFVPAPNILW